MNRDTCKVSDQSVCSTCCTDVENLIQAYLGELSSVKLQLENFNIWYLTGKLRLESYNVWSVIATVPSSWYANNKENGLLILHISGLLQQTTQKIIFSDGAIFFLNFSLNIPSLEAWHGNEKVISDFFKTKVLIFQRSHFLFFDNINKDKSNSTTQHSTCFN